MTRIAPLSIPCPTCDAPVGVSCPQFADDDTNHIMRAWTAPMMEEQPVSLYLDLRIGNDRVADIRVTRQDVQHGNDPERVNTYRWYYTQDGGNEDTGLIQHRFGDGAVVLAQKVLGEIIGRQAITVEALKKLSAGLAPNV